jgi:peptidoglycan/xylan/chitin deacetylase (PgdA/CDA1 family)
LDVHDRTGIKASFFFPAEAALLMKETVRAVVREGHEVGCHGLTHRSETYNSMPAVEQEEKLTQATRQIEDVIQRRVTFFRAPVFKISGHTLRVLEQLGYEADLSMNSQRLGILSSDVWNVTWILAPRSPYHPDLAHPWRRGRSKLWEIPLSCLLFPFMINTGQALGLKFMTAFVRVLYLEARYRPKPIVFMLHPEDLDPQRSAPARPAFRWRDLLPTTDRGLGIRHRFYETNPAKVVRLAHGLLDEVRQSAGVRFLTVSEYVGELERA